MAQPTNTFDSYDSVNFEDLSDTVYNISPVQTPFLSMAARTKATNVNHEWTTDALAAAAANAQIEGDDYSAEASTAATRLGNRCQILKKVAAVSGTNESIDTPGNNATMSYQMAKRSKELKRDLEKALTGEQGSVTGNSTTAREMGGFESWISDNVSHGAGGSTTGFSSGNTADVTDGTQRALTESLVKTQIQNAWADGGDPTVFLVGPKNKAVCSGFAGIATQFKSNTASPATILGAADVYVSDFGEHRIVPDRFSRDRTLLGIDFDYVATSYLRPFMSFELAKTGDTNKRAILCECTLEMRAPSAHFKVADLTTP